MKNNHARIVLVETPDGNSEMIYINGGLSQSSDMLYSTHWINIINTYTSFDQVIQKELTWDAANKYWEEGFPTNFEKYNESDFE